MQQKIHPLRIRLYMFLSGIETIIESLTCNSIQPGEIIGKRPDGGYITSLKVCWWTPATWLAWFRTVILRDNCGSAYFRSIENNMKLIYCPECKDIIKLNYGLHECICKASWSHYLEDGLNAVYGGLAIPLGIHNNTFIQAIENQPDMGLGRNFIAFVIPKQCDTFKQACKHCDCYPCGCGG